MGIIQKQAVRNTALSFISIGIGVISQIIMLLVLSKTEIGALSLLNSISSIIATLFCLGFTQVTLKIFSGFRDEKTGHSGFFIFGLIFTIVGIVLGLVTFHFFQGYIVGRGNETKLIQSLAYLIFPIIFFKIIFRNMDIYLRMLFKSIAGLFLEGVVLKFLIFIGLLLFWLNWIDYQYLAYIYVAALCIPGVIILILSIRNTTPITYPQKEKFKKKERIKIIDYSLFGLFSSASAVIIISIDQVMINKMIGTDAVGIYSVIFFAGILVNVPSRGLKRITVPILSDSWAKNNLDNINQVYRKSVSSQTVVSFYLFIVGWACIQPALTYLPDYQEGLYVFFFIGIAQLFDMMSGVNMEILVTSSKYRANMYLNILLAVLIIILNFIFIQRWGISGAAAASALAMLIINIIRWYYLKIVFKLQPFDLKFLKILAIGTIMLILISITPLSFHPIISILLYTVSITLIYWSIVFKLNLSDDVKNWVLKMKQKFLKQ